MNIAVYWKTLKKKAESLTGVQKVSVGLIGNKSGVSKKLKLFVKAPPGQKKTEAAMAAIKAIDLYVSKIHTKELKKAKKEYSPEQQKSLKIVSKGLARIKFALNQVVLTGQGTGDMNRDVDNDAAWTLYKDDVMKHLELRKKVATGIKSMYGEYVQQVKAIAQIGDKAKLALGAAKQSQQEGNQRVNTQALQVLLKLLSDAEKIYEDCNSRAARELRNEQSPQMQARKNPANWAKVPESKRLKYGPALEKYLDVSWRYGQQIEIAIHRMKQLSLQVALIAEAGDNFSIQPIDAQKYQTRLEKIEGEMKKANVLLSKCSSLDKPDMASKTKYEEDCKRRLLTYALGREDFCDKQAQILSDHAGRIQRGTAALKVFRTRLRQVPGGVLDQQQALRELHTKLNVALDEQEDNIERWSDKLVDFNDVIKTLRKED